MIFKWIGQHQYGNMDKDQKLKKLLLNKSRLKEHFYVLKLILFRSFAAELNNQESNIDMLFELDGGKRLGRREINRKKN